jgi:putative flippase GtrA
MPTVPAAVIAFMVSVISNFLLHRFWTFKDKSHHFQRQFASFFIISIINLGITASCIYIFADVFGLWYLLAKLITATIVLIWSYWANRMWTFKIDTSK